MFWIFRKKAKTLDQKIDEMGETLDDLLVAVQQLNEGDRKTMASLEALQAGIAALIADVTAEGDTVQAAVTAIKGLTDQQAVLSQELADAIAANDPAAIQAAADSIKAANDLIVSQTASLAAAIPATPPAA
jgi:peptidoglycan hydrolase CwlO-like protein